MNLLLLTSLAAFAADQPISYTFEATLGDNAWTCGASTEKVAPHDIRFFVSEVQVHDTAGNTAPVALTPDGQWQNDSVALIDLAPGCKDTSPETHTTLTGTAPEGDWTRVSFTLGVPFENNHKNPATAKAPLTTTAMHWSWRGGYKFLRVDAGDGAFHLGSTGCEGPMAKIKHCTKPNRARVTLTAKPGATLQLALDAIVPAGRCMSMEKEACEGVMSALGVQHSDGASAKEHPAWTVR